MQRLDEIPIISVEEWKAWNENPDNIEGMYLNIAYALGIENGYVTHQHDGVYFVEPNHFWPLHWSWIYHNTEAFSLITKLNINIQHMSFFSPEARYILVGVSGDFFVGFKTGDYPEEALRTAICWMAAKLGNVLREMKNEKSNTKED